MVSNTKLFPEQKSYVKQYCAGNNVSFFSNEKVVVMVKPEFTNSRMVAVSFATMSPDEKKFRKSVGKYYAISNFENGQYVLMDRVTFNNFMNYGDGFWAM